MQSENGMYFDSLDIFCHVVDNFGDIGVVYRLAKEFKAAFPGITIRVFVDDYKILCCIQPRIDIQKRIQEYGGVVYVDWALLDEDFIRQSGTADVLIEAFGCDIPEMVLEAASKRKTVIINLEYLSAEKWVEGYHRKESLLGRGELRKYFFMPGFTKNTGGVIIDTLVESKRHDFAHNRSGFFKNFFTPFDGFLEIEKNLLWGTIFTYEYCFEILLDALKTIPKRIFLLVFDVKSINSMMRAFQTKKAGKVSDSLFCYENTVIALMPFQPQSLYDELLCVSDFNFVRGEDSLVRAVLSGKPFIWNAYAQENNYQQVKIKAFLEAFQPYFDEEHTYLRFHDMLMSFNDRESRLPFQCMQERFEWFFNDLNKINRATEKMSYFMYENCNLVKNLMEFLLQMEK
jgi:uncharacterized repeat protein (TIGR03837 family)